MSQPDNPKKQQVHSLLRRLLQAEQQAAGPEPEPTPPVAAAHTVPPAPEPSLPPDPPTPPAARGSRPLPSRTTPTSPIRPTVPDDSQPQPPLTPTPPNQPAVQPLTPREQMQRAEEALINLRQKMAQVAAEFSEGKLNPAQFDAIYGRYSEQRLITERLLARDPESQAWQSVVRPGHTSFLKQHYESKVLSYAIYNQDTFDLITITGTMRVSQGQVEAVLKRLDQVRTTRGNPGPAKKQINDGRCVLFMPGELTAAAVIFSLEPSDTQIKRIQDLHQDFERANQYALRSQHYEAERLVYPHRALFEEQKNR